MLGGAAGKIKSKGKNHPPSLKLWRDTKGKIEESPAANG